MAKEVKKKVKRKICLHDFRNGVEIKRYGQRVLMQCAKCKRAKFLLTNN